MPTVEASTSISLEDVSFEYRRLNESAASLKKLASQPFADLYITKSIFRNFNLEIMSGENVGIIGSNGAGKSTLLKLMAGLFPPTSGRIRTLGSIAPLMDLGAGFHGELTAEENIRLNNTLLGRNESDVTSILNWADLHNERHTPVRTFSSGMVARLAFSIATNTISDADILLIDEVLSVGDLKFQKKSLERMHSFIKGGSTIVLVSHNLDLMELECSRIVWLEKGEIMNSGEPHEVISDYKKHFIEGV